MILEYNLQFFAKEGPGGEKTEDPTAKKLEDARKEGQVAKSKEIANVLFRGLHTDSGCDTDVRRKNSRGGHYHSDQKHDAADAACDCAYPCGRCDRGNCV